MASSALPTVYNLRAPAFGDKIVDKDGVALDALQKYFVNVNAALISLNRVVNVADFGARGNGTADDSIAVQLAINTALKNGGGIVFFPQGDFRINFVTVPAGSAPITFMGQGPATTIRRLGVITPGVGMFDILGANVSFSDMVIDGDKTTPTGLQYNADFLGINGNDPMANSLTQNTSVWVHGPTSNVTFVRMRFQHAAGYSVLVDALSGDITDISFIQCKVINNRPTLFGTSASPLIYGSWNGGIFLKGDGRTLTAGVISNVLVTQCDFERNTGNCLWQHTYGLVRLHSNVRFMGNFFLDCGLDGILVGGNTGGVVDTNVFRRIGYTTLTDTDQSIPRWLTGLNATALDSSGMVIGVPYTNNSFLNINGGGLDLDSHGYSTIEGNICRVSYPYDPEYDEDRVAISGINGTGATGYGCNLGNTGNTPQGASNVSIVGNTFINLSAGSVRLFAGRDCLVASNDIIAPDAPIAPPVSLGPIGVGPNQRATGNKICHNRVTYNPGSPAPVVFEDDTITPFVGTDINQVFGNCPISPAGSLATEFQSAAGSGSPTYAETVWFP